MSANLASGTDLHRLIDEAYPIIHSASPDDSWIGAIRARGVKDALSLPLPDRKQEAWRYTSTNFLEKTRYEARSEAAHSDLQLADIQDLLLDGATGTRLVFVNGYLAPKLSEIPLRQHAISLSSLSGGLGPVRQALRSRIGESVRHDDVFAALNSALMTDGALIRISGDSLVEAPIELLHLTVDTGQPVMCHPRHLVVLEEGGRAELIERYCTVGGNDVLTNSKIDVSLASGSMLRHQRLLEEDQRARHLSDLQVHLDSQSRYEMSLLALGARWSRSNVRLVFQGEGAEAELDGLMLAVDGQLNDVHLDVRHDAPRCQSRESFRGILGGRGRVVFDGRIAVARDAQKTDARLSNDNLMLSRAAEVDSKPQLEIYADDVKCSHGTTVGELDNDMLFYLRSRGIAEERAVQMLCQGFAAEIVDRIPDEALRKRASGLIESGLAKPVRAAAESGGAD